jgi:hypothetical protein
MGAFTNSRPLQAVAILASLVVLGLNTVLIAQNFGLDLIP